jgi:NAD(P)-dependent dehydrogenase (short-subunit alcohol dehydrogenase family)
MTFASSSSVSPAPGRGEFDGRLAFITGAGSGIGAATARLLADRGAHVVLADIDARAADAIAADIEGRGGRAFGVAVDVADPQSIERAITTATHGHGGLDLAVNAAGIAGSLTPCSDYDVGEWQRVIGINLTGLFLCMRLEIAQMLRRGGGTLVNVSSIMGRQALPGTSAYAASKHGVEGLTKAAALDYATQGIRINAVAPGYVDTPMISGRKATTHERIVGMHPVGRLAQAAEIARMIAFLLSPQASFITGSIHLADGGYSAR